MTSPAGRSTRRHRAGRSVPRGRRGRSVVAALVGLGLAMSLVAGAQAATASVPVTAGATASPPTSFTITGAGWGHGVGLSQYGAYGMALDGTDATTILTHYFTGTQVTPVTDAVPLTVNLLHRVATASLRTETVTDPTGGSGAGAAAGTITVSLAGGATVTGSTADTWGLSVSGSSVALTRNGTSVGSAPSVSVSWAGTTAMPGGATVLNVIGPGQFFADYGHRYRYGTVTATVVSGLLEVVNTVSLHDHYLYGIGEMPSSWPAAALQAQVIASRSYALYAYHRGVNPACACNVYDSTYSQVFVGWSKQASTSGAAWVAAVNATDASPTTASVVTYQGSVAQTFFFSSSGGRTRNSEDGFVSYLPYLRSVDDHWSQDPAVNNPFASWTRTVSQQSMAAAFGLPDVVRLDLSVKDSGGAVKTATAWSSTGATASISGNALAGALGLPSSWMSTTGQTAPGRAVSRLAGADRYQTAVAIAAAAFPSSSTVVIVDGEPAHLVDGLVAAPLAYARKAPVLFATADGLPVSTAAAITARKPSSAILVGGPGALGAGVVAALRALGVGSITQIGGADRYATAAMVAQALGPGSLHGAFLASGTSLVDALSAGGVAARLGEPVLLTAATALPAVTSAALTGLQVTHVDVVGGPSVVSDAVLSALPGANRLAGTDRFATAVAVDDAFAATVGTATVVVASGADANLVDALAAGTLGRLTLLVMPTSVPSSTSAWLTATPTVGTVTVVGGVGAVSTAVGTAVAGG